MSEDTALAAIVAKEHVDTVIAELKEAGCYDSDRRIREAADGSIEIPVTEVLSLPEIQEFKSQRDPPFRIRMLDDYLREAGADPEIRETMPKSWSVIGDVIVVQFGECRHKQVVADALLDLHGQAQTVLSIEKITGAHREPSVTVVAGTGDTETVHREHGIEYALDLATVMFSRGNKRERQRMGSIVDPGETVIDMFAGIGYFSLPMAVAGASVTAIEQNPAALQYLLENRERNNVDEMVSVYQGDCGEIVPKLASKGPIADRIHMGHFSAKSYLEAACAAIKPDGVIHIHSIEPADEPFAKARSRIAAQGLAVDDCRIVKTHGPGTVHTVIDARRPKCG